MKFNETNIIVEDVFNEEELLQIQNAVSKSHGSHLVEIFAQKINYIELSDSIIEKVTNIAKGISDNKNLVLTEFCHSRYNNIKNDNGDVLHRPTLFPHYDETFEGPRFTLDYQLKANVDWPISVQPDKAFILKDNNAVTFSGTHQIHWREPKVFENDQFVEMLFFHFSDPTITDVDKDLKNTMDSQSLKYTKEYLYKVLRMIK
jgi:hypothetical protein